MIRSGEFPNEAIPKDIESRIQSGRAAARAAPKPDRVQYPAWYLNLPVKQGCIYAVGEKTFGVKETALAMAEAAAAASIAEQVRVQLASIIEESSNAQGSRIESRIQSEAAERLPYRIVERVYNEKTGTAFVLAELTLTE